MTAWECSNSAFNKWGSCNQNWISFNGFISYVKQSFILTSKAKPSTTSLSSPFLLATIGCCLGYNHCDGPEEGTFFSLGNKFKIIFKKNSPSIFFVSNYLLVRFMLRSNESELGLDWSLLRRILDTVETGRFGNEVTAGVGYFWGSLRCKACSITKVMSTPEGYLIKLVRQVV